MLLLVLLAMSGCATRQAVHDRSFEFGRDTFSFANELVWEYTEDPVTGEFRHQRRSPKPDYTHHCFVVARAAKQFFNHARFSPAEPKGSESIYKRKVNEILERNPRKVSPPEERVVLPGYSNLHEFSRDWEDLIKNKAGSAIHSYVQRGHWRMVFPFSRRHQAATAGSLKRKIEANDLPVVHLVRFPQLSINHAVVLFDAAPDPSGIRFSVYDPNEPENPTELFFDPQKRGFYFPKNDYFKGGKVSVYEVYRGIWY